MIPEFTGAELDKPRALSRWGSPLSRRAARKLLAGRLPTPAEITILAETASRGRFGPQSRNTNDKRNNA